MVVGLEGADEQEILSRLQSPETVTAVVNRFTVCRTVPSRKHTRTYLLLVLRIMIPSCIARKEINRVLLFPIALCASAKIIITPQVMTLGRIPMVVLLVMVIMPLLMWLLLGEGRIRIMSSSH